MNPTINIDAAALDRTVWTRFFHAQSKHEYARLRNSIANTGFDDAQPIIVRRNPDSGIVELVDGSHRLTACEELGVEPVFADKSDALPDDDSVRDYIFAKNTARRSFTIGQLIASFVARAVQEGQDTNDSEWRLEVRRLTGCGDTELRNKIKAHLALRKGDPQTADEVVAGVFPESEALLEKAKTIPSNGGATSIPIGNVAHKPSVRRCLEITAKTGKQGKTLFILGVELLHALVVEAGRQGVRTRGKDALGPVMEVGVDRLQRAYRK